MRIAVIRGLCALACALAFHAALVAVAVRLGWLAPDDATLPELDLTSVDLSFSDTPDETAAPTAARIVLPRAAVARPAAQPARHGCPAPGRASSHRRASSVA